MKTETLASPTDAAPIVQLADVESAEVPTVDVAAVQEAGALQRARAFAEPLLSGHLLDTGEPALAHADGVAGILESIGAAPALRAAAYLVYAADFLQRPEEVVRNAFGDSYAGLVEHTRKLVAVQRAAREATVEAERREQQTERVRKMLLAFSRDLRVVLLRLASRLQTLRWHAAAKQPCAPALALESQQVFAPLANRLGIWQIKWELEDLSFRFLQPSDYARIARQLDETRTHREQAVRQASERLRAELAAAGVDAQVQGRPKHLFSIWKKMQGKGVDLASIYDLRALRVVVNDVRDCYAALSCVHARWRAVPGQFDDYIAKPKANGYQSLHTVVQGDDGHAIEVQIRTRAMHEHAEYGVAAHWAYKEAGARGYAGVSAAGGFEGRVALARKAVLRQLLAWERDHAAQVAPDAAFDDRIFVFTPQATVLELPVGATPVDFAYALHTDLGHRCRGARVDGVMVPLNTPLANGQTVEVVAIKDGGPSLDWLNAELRFLKSPRARAKVRAWFNARAQADTIARGRELVEKLLQREGRTSLKHDELAARLGFKGADALFEVVGKDEFSLRTIENLLRPQEVAPPATDVIPLRRARASEGGVLVVGVDSLMTSLARCCRPAPPDAIGGYVTRGKGVAIHRTNCTNFRQMLRASPERAIPVAWGAKPTHREALYPVKVRVEANDRTGLLRDISELFAKERMNVTAVQSQTSTGALGTLAQMEITVEVDDALRLPGVLALISRIPGVRSARRG
ncbi:MAG TPA: bifunctional (p)ppGpp synthetase/guanosine-3',5'-bis(diphosphate) 3'-pyrophosphohydrolase [Burkholderiaceae bacterium]|nr:bifunctional (p)ppGpp synthetase/guanosine-3',5'-bis(diphosphate) 3'-pyrophosphohydrolase [Burkholderiaceae bacterium]